MSEKLMGWVNNLAEPKRANRWELLFNDDLRLTCHSAKIPNISVDKVEIDRMHEKYYVAGSKVTYGDVSLSFYDFVDNKAAAALQAWYTKIYDQGTSLMGYPQDYKQDVTLLVYGPDHSIVESWLLVGAWPVSLTRPSNLDWKAGGAGDIRNIDVDLRVDQAKLTLS